MEILREIITRHKKKAIKCPDTTSTSSRILPSRPIQSFVLIWLDSNTDKVDDRDIKNTMTKLRQVVNTVTTFTDVDACVTFINENTKKEKIVMISSGTLGERIVPRVHEIEEINDIYIFCGDQTRHQQWTQRWTKIKGVFTEITPICETLKQDCADQHSVLISFMKINEGISNRNLNELDPSFMYTQILKEILLTIDFDQEYFHQFIKYCREYFIDNSIELKNVDKIEREYRHYQPIWWYTRESFLHAMLNKALRTMEVDLIIQLGFFVRDLHQHISTLHSEQYGGHGHRRSRTFIVYRGQRLSSTDSDLLMKAEGGLLSFNSFLSTSECRHVSLNIARRTTETSQQLFGILFIMRIDPSISSTPFAKVREISAHPKEEEILFSMHSIFRIGQIKQIDPSNNRLWQVELTLTNDNDPQLCGLTEHIRRETLSGYGGWYRLGVLLIKLGQYDKAELVYELLRGKVTKKGEEAHLYHMLGTIKNEQGKYIEAIDFYEKSIKINQKILFPTDSALAATYNNIGSVYDSINEYSKALSYYEKAFDIYRKTLPPDHSDLATSYNNIGGVYEQMEKYSKALSYYKKALEIYQKTLPSNHPNLAACYNNIGGVYEHMGQYSKALSSHRQALEIRDKTLPPNHPDLACSYGQIGMVYSQLGDHTKSVRYCERALEIAEHSLPSNHPDVQLYQTNLQSVKDKLQ